MPYYNFLPIIPITKFAKFCECRLELKMFSLCRFDIFAKKMFTTRKRNFTYTGFSNLTCRFFTL